MGRIPAKKARPERAEANGVAGPAGAKKTRVVKKTLAKTDGAP